MGISHMCNFAIYNEVMSSESMLMSVWQLRIKKTKSKNKKPRIDVLTSRP
jgi:hypothetical protein